MGLATTGQKYILILKNDFSGFIMLHACNDSDSETTITALMKWFALFGVVPTWVSDRGSHFKNRIVAGVKSALHAQHHLTTAYCPWANGSVERVCREVLRACRALFSEFRMLTTEWPAVSPLIQSPLNNSPYARLGGLAPSEVLLNVRADSPLRTIAPDLEHSPMSFSDIRAEQILHMNTLKRAVEEMHHTVRSTATTRRAASLNAKNSTHAVVPNFDVGDFVLVARQVSHAADKLTRRCLGPQRVVKVISEWVYSVEDLRHGEVQDVDATRLRYYADEKLNVDADLINQVAHNEQGFPVAGFKELTYSNEDKCFVFGVSWHGFEEADDTYEFLETMMADVPQKVSAYLDRHPDKDLALRTRASLLTRALLLLRGKCSAISWCYFD
jgi:hypothetical protein